MDFFGESVASYASVVNTKSYYFLNGLFLTKDLQFYAKLLVILRGIVLNLPLLLDVKGEQWFEMPCLIDHVILVCIRQSINCHLDIENRFPGWSWTLWSRKLIQLATVGDRKRYKVKNLSDKTNTHTYTHIVPLYKTNKMLWLLSNIGF